MVIMKREIATISRDGRITIPANPQMADFEIAELFGVSVPKIRTNIRSLLKSGIFQDECLNGGIVMGKTIYPLYYGLEMITALSFRIDSANARVFREWMLKRIISNNMQQTLLISLPQSHISN